MSKEDESIIPVDSFNNKNTKIELPEEEEIHPMDWAEIYGPKNYRRKI